jgi:hypothetical protein
MQDEFLFEILEDGTVRQETGSFTEAAHITADKLSDRVKLLLGGETRTKKKGKQEHAHHHHHHRIEQK